MWSILSTIIVGYIVSLIARAIKPGSDSMGWVMTTVLGIVGAALANFVGASIGWYKSGEVAGWIASVIGAVAVLAIYGMIAKK